LVDERQIILQQQTLWLNKTSKSSS